MKFTTLLLAAYIGFLTVQPEVYIYPGAEAQVKKSSQHSCCSKKQETKKQEHKDPCKERCANGFCNPFGECTCCLGISALPSYQFLSITPVKELIAIPSANLSSHYLADCFHPPESA